MINVIVALIVVYVVMWVGGAIHSRSVKDEVEKHEAEMHQIIIYEEEDAEVLKRFIEEGGM